MTAFLKVFDIIPGWLFAVLVGVLLILLGVDGLRIAELKTQTAEARAAIADLKTQYAQAAQKAEADARAEESRRTEAARKVVQDAHTQVAEAEHAARDADDAAGRLQSRVASLIAASRRPVDPAAGGRSPSVQGADPLDLLASVLTRMGDDGGQVAAFADRLRIAGRACEAQYDTLTAKP